jgi:hypothetical protein
VLAITPLSVRNCDYQQMHAEPTHRLFVALASIVMASALALAFGCARQPNVNQVARTFDANGNSIFKTQ